MGNIKEDSFIILSDFHSNDWPLDLIENNYIKRFDKIFILGDATDRGKKNDGTNGINVLLRIKQLSEKYPDRVIYIPGNHDEMLYNYTKTGSFISRDNLLRNGGSQTIKDIDALKNENSKELEELIEWLGSQPLQREHYYDNQRYVFAHALFNEKLFKENKKFNLEDFSKNVLKYDDIIWFRKRFDTPVNYYKKENLPSDNSIMIIGHTPIQYRRNKNLDLINSDEKIVKIYCVDGGTSAGGELLKFDSNTKRVEPAINLMNNSIVNESEDHIETSYDYEELLRKLILDIVINSKDLEESVKKVQKSINNKTSGSEFDNYISQLLLYYSTKNNTINYNEIIRNIISKTILDYIIDCLIKKYNSKAMAIVYLEFFIEDNNIDYISNKTGRAKEYAKKIPIEEFKKVMEEKTSKEYINEQYGKSLIK